MYNSKPMMQMLEKEGFILKAQEVKLALKL